MELQDGRDCGDDHYAVALDVTGNTIGLTLHDGSTWQARCYDRGNLITEIDPLSNLTTLPLPTGQHLNHLYYGSGHLHQLNLDGQLIS
ncbi:hypothetical protein, partial [Pseudomonas syringae]|uniref:hypothetical protein n=1 Tax=Pseudomonas syringae TaxID=317 RepID=UPI0013C34185